MKRMLAYGAANAVSPMMSSANRHIPRPSMGKHAGKGPLVPDLRYFGKCLGCHQIIGTDEPHTWEAIRSAPCPHCGRAKW